MFSSYIFLKFQIVYLCPVLYMKSVATACTYEAPITAQILEPYCLACCLDSPTFLAMQPWANHFCASVSSSEIWKNSADCEV